MSAPEIEDYNKVKALIYKLATETNETYKENVDELYQTTWTKVYKPTEEALVAISIKDKMGWK